MARREVRRRCADGQLVEQLSRGAHPTDRRATLVGLTVQGATAAERMDGERRAAAHALFGDLPAADLACFVAVTDHVLRHFGAPGPEGARRTTGSA